MKKAGTSRSETTWKTFLHFAKQKDGSAELTLGFPFAFALVMIVSLAFGANQLPQIRFVLDMLAAALKTVHLLN